ncbi:MAG: TrmH family RNA methyltransferase [Pseudomonadota bacterium]|nr:TrmH family RNA methyltransferase [Pseudomonadota bacterium]
MSNKRKLSKQERRHYHEQMLRRYTKQRHRNAAAVPGCQQMIFVLDHLKAGFNVAKIFRSAESFGVHEIHLIDIPAFDPAPSKGAFRKVPARFHDHFDSCYEELIGRGYKLFTLEPECEATLNTTELPEKSAFIMGHEEHGISIDHAQFDIQCRSIPQYGATQSLNVSIAASIVMYEYSSRFRSE